MCIRSVIDPIQRHIAINTFDRCSTTPASLNEKIVLRLLRHRWQPTAPAVAAAIEAPYQVLDLLRRHLDVFLRVCARKQSAS